MSNLAVVVDQVDLAHVSGGPAIREREESLTFLEVRGAMRVYPLRAVFSSRPCVPTPRLLWSATAGGSRGWTAVRSRRAAHCSPSNDVLVHLACNAGLSEV